MITPALALVLTAAAPAEDEWRRHPEFVRAAAAFAESRWDEAERAFAAAYEDHPRPELLWARAQALRLGKRCDEAVPLYRLFLASDPAPEEAEDARINIAACGESPDPPPVDAAPPLPRPPVDRAEPAPTEVVTPRRPVARDPWGHGLLWSGVAEAALGAALLGEAHARQASAHREREELDYRRAYSGAPALSQAGIAILATGAALVTAGVVRFVVLGARERRRKRMQLLVSGPVP